MGSEIDSEATKLASTSELDIERIEEGMWRHATPESAAHGRRPA